MKRSNGWLFDVIFHSLLNENNIEVYYAIERIHVVINFSLLISHVHVIYYYHFYNPKFVNEW